MGQLREFVVILSLLTINTVYEARTPTRTCRHH